MIVIFGITKGLNFIKEKTIFVASINSTIPGINKMEEEHSESKQTYIEKILSTQLAMNDNLIKQKYEEAQNTEENNNENSQNTVIAENENDKKTEVISENNIKATYTNEYKGIQIKNSSKYNLTEEILNPNINLDNNKNISIYHTHTCESYTPSEKYNYEMTGTYRTTDTNYSVVRVGDELKNFLEKYNFNVLHDATLNDYPAYTGSYNRSLKVVEQMLNVQYSDVVIDLHRDAVGSNSNYAPTVKIGNEYAAQLMFVIGTDGGGLEHPNWQQNLKFAIKIQEKANEMYPGLFRPIILRNSRYNQHVAKGACIIEVGATGNTLDQCIISMKYLAEILNEALPH